MSSIDLRRFHRQADGGPIRAYKVVQRIKDSSMFRPVYFETFTAQAGQGPNGVVLTPLRSRVRACMTGIDIHDFLYAVGSTSTAKNAIGMFCLRNVKEARLWGNHHCNIDWAILEVNVDRKDVLRTEEDWIANLYIDEGKKTYFPVMTTKILKVTHAVEYVEVVT